MNFDCKFLNLGAGLKFFPFFFVSLKKYRRLLVVGVEFDQFAQQHSAEGVAIVGYDSDLLLCGMAGATTIWAPSQGRAYTIDAAATLGGLGFYEMCRQQGAYHASQLERLELENAEAAAAWVRCKCTWNGGRLGVCLCV